MLEKKRRQFISALFAKVDALVLKSQDQLDSQLIEAGKQEWQCIILDISSDRFEFYMMNSEQTINALAEGIIEWVKYAKDKPWPEPIKTPESKKHETRRDFISKVFSQITSYTNANTKIKLFELNRLENKNIIRDSGFLDNPIHFISDNVLETLTCYPFEYFENWSNQRIHRFVDDVMNIVEYIVMSLKHYNSKEYNEYIERKAIKMFENLHKTLIIIY